MKPKLQGFYTEAPDGKAEQSFFSSLCSLFKKKINLNFFPVKKLMNIDFGRIYRFFLTGLLLFFCFSAVSAQTADQDFERGNKQYEQKNYQEAVNAYQKVLDKGQQSAALYYNLGNANYKLNRIAPAVYNYERALKLKPNDADIKNNLAFAQKMTIDAITPLPQNTFDKWYNAILNLLPTDGWAILTVALILLFMVAFVAYFLVYGTIKKRVFFSTAFTSLGFGLLALFFAFRSEKRMNKDRPAIVFSAQAEVKASPNLSGDNAFTLHEGTKVMVLSENPQWKEIRIADGKEGWIPKTDIKEF